MSDSLFRSATPCSQRLQFGHSVEASAWEWLLAQSLKSGLKRRLLDRGFRGAGGEIDLVFEEDGPRGRVLVFLEVRSRVTRHGWQSGLEAVGFRKRKHLLRAAKVYLARYRGLARQVRWDIVFFDGQVFSYFPDAWREEACGPTRQA